ncbi:MAG: hypothetical protein MJ096_02475, partial [Clostridia bacterium]|nr:hypothetical protein [Clostridia bacterium]
MKRITGFFLCIIIAVGLVTVPAHTSDYDGRYCRTALAELPKGDALCYAYDAMLTGFLALDGKIPLDVERGLTYDDVVTVAEALRSDCPEPFWQADGFSVSLKSDGRVSGITPNYVHTAAEAEAMTALMSREADEICALVHGTDEMQIALELHDALARRVTYNEGEDAHNAYGALVRGVAVCEGSARASQYLLRRFGVESAVVIGDSRGGAHAWNLVCIDGAWVNVDVTWDDAGDKLFHRYFAVNDAVINEDHTRDATAYALPACVGEEYPYFKEGYNRFGTFSVDTLAALMSENFVSGTAYAEFLVGDSDAFAVWLSGHSRDLMSALGMTGSVSYATSALEGEMHLTFGSHKHTAGTSDGKAATCTEDGYAGNYYCTSCGALFSDAACCFVIDDLAAWRATDGRVAASGHNWDGGTVVTEPTETEKGVMRFTCTECGAERDGEIPVKEKEPGPVEPTKTFIDVSETSWFKGAVDYVV